MKLFTQLLIVTIIALSCTQKSTTEIPDEPNLITPLTLQLETASRDINKVSGDSIKALIINGDTVVTGKEFRLSHVKILIDTCPKPEISTTSAPEKIVIDNDIHDLASQVFEVDASKFLKTQLQLSGRESLNHGKRFDSIAVLEKECIESKAILLTNPTISAGSRNNVKVHSTETGLPSDFISCVFYDSRKIMWIGTMNSGVIKSDGNEISVYNSSNGFATRVEVIVETKNGHLWFGTKEGLIEYDGQRFNYHLKKLALSINDLEVDESNNLWAATNGGVLKVDSTGKYVLYTTSDGLTSNDVLDICTAKHDNIWVSGPGGLCVFRNDSITKVKIEQLKGKDLTALENDKADNIWVIADDSSLYKYDGKHLTEYLVSNVWHGKKATQLFIDSQNRKWLGSWEGAAMISADGKFTPLDGISSPRISSFTEDDAGNIVISTKGGGINTYNPDRFNYLPELPGDTWVMSMHVNRDSSITLGTFDKGLLFLKKNEIIRFSSDNGLITLGHTISSVSEDKFGYTWYGTKHGACRFVSNDKNTGKFELFTSSHGLPANDITYILSDEEILWFATPKGICSFDGVNITQYKSKNMPLSLSVKKIFKDTKKNIWFTTFNSGLYKITHDKSNIICYSEKEGLPSSAISELKENANAELWALFDNGIGSIDHNTIRFYKFPRNTVPVNFTFDGLRKIWITSQSGLYCLELESLKSRSGRLHNYSKHDGLKSKVFFPNGLCTFRNFMLCASADGVLKVNLKDFTIPGFSPPPFLNHIEISNTFIDYRNFKDSAGLIDKFADIVSFRNYPEKLEIPYNSNHLTFHFSMYDWNAPQKCKFTYYLQGVDNKWSTPSTERKADYRGLENGVFTFKLCSVSESGKWSTPIEYSFTVLPPWWKTWWARALLVISLFPVVFGIYKWRVQQLLKKQAELEIKIAAATMEIKKQKGVIEEKHREITDSINYAERIQRSFLATKKTLEVNLPDYFVLFRPKEAVSGDFYWAAGLKGGSFALTVADSTGHGVPGAIMSILNISSLEKAIEDQNRPAAILNSARTHIIDRLKKDGSLEGGKDGMDCSFIILNALKTKMQFASAHNPILLIRNKELIELPYDKMPVGRHDRDNISFTDNEIELQKGDVIYMLTDGYPDQFGGPKGKKFKYANLQKVLLAINTQPMAEQKTCLTQIFEEWKGNLEQIDDVCVVGVRI